MHTDEEIVNSLEAAVRGVKSRPVDQVVAEVQQRRNRRRARRRVVVPLTFAVTIAVGTAGVARVARSDGDRPASVVMAPGSERRHSPAATGALSLPERLTPAAIQGAWRSLPTGPLGERLGFASAWTGSELIIWGGWNETPGEENFSDETARYFADGAAYDPAHRTWRTLAPAPGSGRADAKAVWTGKEVVVLGGRNADGVFSDGLAYDPAADDWRPVGEGPLGSSLPGDAVWTGSEIVLTTRPYSDATGRPERILTLDPSADVWEQRRDPPAMFTKADLVVAGDRLFLFSSALDKLGSPTSPGVKVAEWDLRSRAWVPLPTLDDLAPQAFVAEEVSGFLVAVDYLQAAFVSPAEDAQWKGPSAGPLDPIDCPPQAAPIAGSLFVWKCGQAAIVGTDARWINVSEPDLGGTMPWDTTVAAAGDRVLIWGRDFNTHEPFFKELVLSDLQ